MKKKKLKFPVVLLWRDRTIDVKGAAILQAPAVYIAKGRTLTLKNIGGDEKGRFQFRIPMTFYKVKGNIRIAKKPKEMSVEDLRKLQTNEEKNEGRKEENPQGPRQ